jgi:transcriptional regulator with XRE-family HTH domain
MSSKFGTELRNLRALHGLTRAQLAERACVSARAIAYWEAGEFEPREHELRALLQELGVPAADQPRLFGLLDSPRGQKMVYQAAQMQAHALSRLSALPTLGDLLSAIRLRRGLRREQAALLIGVSFSTLARWENNRFQPSEEALMRYRLLGAYPEEVKALCARRLSPFEQNPDFSLKQGEEWVAALVEEIHRPHSSLIDLSVLALKRRLWLLASDYPDALPLLAQVDYHYSHWLGYQDRTLEASRHAQQALQVLTSHTQPERSWTDAINVAVACLVETKGDAPEQGVRALKEWLARVPQPHLQPYMLCDMAWYASRSGQFDMAQQLLKQGQIVFMQMPEQDAHTIDYIQVTMARVLTQMGQIDKAYALMPKTTLPDSESLFRVYLYAALCEKAGESSELERCLAQLNAALNRWSRPRLRRYADALARQL